MKKILLAVAAVVISSNAYAMKGCERKPAPFLGINGDKGHCCFAFEDAEGDTHHVHGEAKITLASNKNFNFAKCLIEIPEEYIDEIAAPVSGRTQLVNECGIHKKGRGNGGFTISLNGGVINGNCKVDVAE